MPSLGGGKAALARLLPQAQWFLECLGLACLGPARDPAGQEHLRPSSQVSGEHWPPRPGGKGSEGCRDQTGPSSLRDRDSQGVDDRHCLWEDKPKGSGF